MELILVVGHDSIVEISQHLEQVMKIFSWCLNEEKVLMWLNFIKDGRM